MKSERTKGTKQQPDEEGPTTRKEGGARRDLRKGVSCKGKGEGTRNERGEERGRGG